MQTLMNIYVSMPITYKYRYGFQQIYLSFEKCTAQMYVDKTVSLPLGASNTEKSKLSSAYFIKSRGYT